MAQFPPEAPFPTRAEAATQTCLLPPSPAPSAGSGCAQLLGAKVPAFPQGTAWEILSPGPAPYTDPCPTFTSLKPRVGPDVSAPCTASGSHPNLRISAGGPSCQVPRSVLIQATSCPASDNQRQRHGFHKARASPGLRPQSRGDRK